MQKGFYRGAYTECNYKKQGVFSLFNSPNQFDPEFSFLKGVLEEQEDDNEALKQTAQQQPHFQYKSSLQKRLFNDSDQYQEFQETKKNVNDSSNSRHYNDIFQEKNKAGIIGQSESDQHFAYGQQSQQGHFQHAQTTYKEKQHQGSLLNLNIRSSRNLLSSFQQISQGNHHQKGEDLQEKQAQKELNYNQQIGLAQQMQNMQGQQSFQRQQQSQNFQAQLSQNLQGQQSQNQQAQLWQNLEGQRNEQMNQMYNTRGVKHQYLTDVINNNNDSQSSSNSSQKKEQPPSQMQNNIFAQFQNQQKVQQQIAIQARLPSSQHQSQQLIEFNRFKGFQNKNNDLVFQTQTQLSSASSQNQQSSNKENSQNTSHSSTSSSGISLHTFSDYQSNNNNNPEVAQPFSGIGQSTVGQSKAQQQYQQQIIKTPSSQNKLQQYLSKEINHNVFQNSQSRQSTYQTAFIPLKQPDNFVSFEKNIFQSQQNQKQNTDQQLKTQLSDNLSYFSKPQNFSTSSSSLSSSSQIQSSTHPSCSSPSSQSSCSSEAHPNLKNLSFSSTHKSSFPSSSTRLQSQISDQQRQGNSQQNNQQQQFIQTQSSTGKQGKFGSSGKKPFGKNKQLVYYEKQQSSSNSSQSSSGPISQPFQTPVKQDTAAAAAPTSIAACQEDNYQNQYGFNSPLYTPNTIGKLHKIKESFYEGTPLNEFKQRFARKIKQLRQELKDNCKTPDTNQINTGNTSTASQLGSSLLQKEIKQKLTFIEILGSSIAKLSQVKPNMYWKLMFELADFAKKDCMYHEAKYFYKIAINLQPFCSDIWLEYAKMEEDYGNLQKAKEILENAYPFCKMSDSLILKLLRIIEKIGTIKEVRKILSNLNQLKIEKCWKIYIEGAQIEIRFGNLKNSERILRMLHHYLDLNGQVCYEYARILELQGKYSQALHICQQAQEKGLKCTSLWTLYLKLYEKTCTSVNSATIDKFIRMANQSLPKEIIWKIYLEIAQICEKKNDIPLAKQYLIFSIRSSHESMRWKPLIQVAKIELLQGNVDNANLIIQKALDSCSEKQKPYLIIEAAKCAEIAGHIPQALSQMESLKSHMKSEWKIYMEYISMLIRNKKHKEAGKIIKESLNTHTLAGRLWGELIQLEHIKATNNDLNSAFEFFLVALEEVPKSGEVWCEGARLCMNPFGNKFDLMKAKQFLEYAIFFTPQYGDSFIEALRLYTILGERDQIKQLKSPNYGHLWYYMKDTTRDASIDVWQKMKKQIRDEVNSTFIYYQKKLIALDVSNLNSHPTPMITALTEYNDLFFNDSISDEIRWKTIFYLDQSLNQI